MAHAAPAPLPAGLPRALVEGLEALRSQLAQMADGRPGRHRSLTLNRPRLEHPTPVQELQIVPSAPTPPDDAPTDAPEPPVDPVAALVHRAQAGDPDAFGQLYDRYVDLVHRYVYYRVGSRQLAEDLTSETFLRALRRIGSYTWQGVDIGAWFVTIARNLVADHYKSGRYRLEVQVREVSDERTLDGPEGEVIEALDHQVLLEAITRLGPEQQECIVLRFLQGLSVSETAAVMGKNDGAVKALQYRAVRSLARLLPTGFDR